MATTARRICDACGMEYDWDCVSAGGVDYCCDACARGEACTCPQHDHHPTGEAFSGRAGARPETSTTNAL